MEIVGYIGSALVIISMLMTSLVRLRILNLCGALLSMLYAIAVEAWPVVMLNGALLLIQLVQILRLWRQNGDASPQSESPRKETHS